MRSCTNLQCADFDLFVIMLQYVVGSPIETALEYCILRDSLYLLLMSLVLVKFIALIAGRAPVSRDIFWKLHVDIHRHKYQQKEREGI